MAISISMEMVSTEEKKIEGCSCELGLMEKEEVPEEIIVEEIMSRLPIKALARFRSVSRTLNSVISSDPKFAIHHLNNCLDRQRVMLWNNCDCSSAFFLDRENNGQFSIQKINNSPIEVNKGSSYSIVASGDGLVCILDRSEINKVSILFWNPLTGETKRVSDHPPTGIPPLSKWCTYGLGYDSSTDDYNLVWINLLSDDMGVPLPNEVGAFSLRTNSWRQIEHFTISKVCSLHPGGFINGAVYWTGLSKDSPDPHYQIVSFCLEKEKYRMLEIPLVDLRLHNFYIGTRALGVKLAVYYPSNVDGSYHLIFIDECDNGESWTKHTVTIPSSKRFTPLCLLENVEEVLFKTEGGQLGIYRLKDGTFTHLQIPGLPVTFSVMNFSESLISPNTYKGKKN